MSVTEFAMVQELAFLVKDNLESKHLVLSMEEDFINFLQDDDASLEGVLELKPMSSYNRLLLHRLADIFGFVHESVGEGDDRHLILKQCPETSIPSILVSDILWQYDDEPQSLVPSHQLLRRKDATPALNSKWPSFEHTFEDREAAYMAARERIFSMDLENIKDPVRQRPRNIPVVARRMIAHALGQKFNASNQDVTIKDCKEHEGQTENLNFQEDRVDLSSRSEANQETLLEVEQNIDSSGDARSKLSSVIVRNVSQGPTEKRSGHVSISSNGRSRNGAKKDMKEEHVEAAKRMFAHALGLRTAISLSKCRETKQRDEDNCRG